VIRLFGAALVLVVALAASTSPSGGGIQSALPPHADVLQQASLYGFQSAYAVVYVTDSTNLGVVTMNSGRARLVWTEKVGPLVSDQKQFPLSEPRQIGVFQAIYSEKSSPRQTIFAYRLAGSEVRSAIAGHSSGHLTGTEGIRAVSSGFEVLSPDRRHKGGVRYRWVTTFGWHDRAYSRSKRNRVPDYSAAFLPRPNATVTTANGDVILLRLAVAITEQQKETGLMNIKTLDPDSGMIFAWTQPTSGSFWMENTYVPLTVAFLGQDGTIHETQDMQPLTQTLHTPVAPYLYAVEMNQGFFSQNGIKSGDRLHLHLSKGAGGSELKP
jgi:uncharacterized protein